MLLKSFAQKVEYLIDYEFEASAKFGESVIKAQVSLANMKIIG
jgi:hypothetical protein